MSGCICSGSRADITSLCISYDFIDRLILDIRYTMGGYGVLKNLDINNLNNNSVLSVTIGYRL